MPSLLRTLVITGVAALSLWSPAVPAGDQKFPVDDGVLIVDIDGNWEELDTSEISDRTIGYELTGVMRWIFEPHPKLGRTTITTSELRVLAQDLRREIKAQGGESSDDLYEIEGKDVRGYYVRGTDPKARTGDYRHMYVGYVVVGDSLPVEFSILWMNGGESAAKRAVNAVRGMRLGR